MFPGLSDRRILQELELNPERKGPTVREQTLQPRLAVVGAGYWGKNLVRNFHELGALEAICDVDEARLQRLASTYGTATTSRFEDVLEMPNVQAVAIAAPAAQHFELAKEAMLAGKDVFVEKPLSLQVEEGMELVGVAEKHRRILMVGHLLQYHPAVLELRRRVQNGEFGRLQYIYSSRLNWGKLRNEESILWSFAPHDISAILYLLDEEPNSVVAQADSYLNHHISDTTLTSLVFPSGVKAHIFVSWLHPFKEQKLVVVGDRKMAVFDDTSMDRKLVVYPHRIDWINRVPVAQKAEGKVVPIEETEPLRLECQHFLDAVRERKQPRTDGRNGLQVLQILQACDESIRTKGHPLEIHALSDGYYAHPTAVIDQPCEIGHGTKVWHFAHVMANSRLGKDCILGQNVHIASDVRIGNNVKIQNNVSVYTGVELEDDVFCGPSVVFTNVINPRSHVNRKHEYLPTLVKRGASLGANSTIVCGVNIGQYAFVAAGAVVTRDVPNYALMMGVPARQVGWMCQCGVRLEVAGKKGVCTSCGETYWLTNEGLRKQAFARSA